VNQGYFAAGLLESTSRPNFLQAPFRCPTFMH
jgi:hypothetical protein